MRRFTLQCLLWGHDDRLRRAPGRVYLECWQCGRTTRGWALDAAHQPDGKPLAQWLRTALAGLTRFATLPTTRPAHRR